MHYPYKLPELPYDYDALEPHLSTQQVVVHYKGHHEAYIDRLNDLFKNNPALSEYVTHATRLEDILKDISCIPESVRKNVINFGGGVYNHTFFWKSLYPENTYQLGDALAQAINATFGSKQQFKEKFAQTALDLFGSGWVWLVLDEHKKLDIVSTANQECPISQNLFPLLCLDMWEHAYYVQYQNRKAEYINNFWPIVNWHFAQQRYELGMHR